MVGDSTCLVALLPKGNERERVMKPKGDDSAALAVQNRTRSRSDLC